VHVRGIRSPLAVAAISIVAVGCGGGSSGSDTAAVGDCIDAQEQLVDCDSASAEQTLVSDQSEPDAIACVEIGDKPQVEVTVGDGAFCAEER
jgi:hypothetical protein